MICVHAIEFVLYFRVQPSPDLSLVIEIQTSKGLDLFNHETEGLVSCGWAKFDLFDQHNQVQSGHWRLPFCSPPKSTEFCATSMFIKYQELKVSTRLNVLQELKFNSIWLNTIFLSKLGNMELCLRVANARDGDVQILEKIDPNNTYQYKYISTVCKIFVLCFFIAKFAKISLQHQMSCLGGIKHNPGKPRTM